MGADISQSDEGDAGEFLANEMIEMMRKTGMPNGLDAIGYTPADIPQMVAGTLAQQRLTKLSPRPFDESDLSKLFLDSMMYW
jgi:hydroxyacid-oxoacid transhydrogenase